VTPTSTLHRKHLTRLTISHEPARKLEPLSAACIIAGFVAVAVVQLDEPA
jgi:hypothetical protein